MICGNWPDVAHVGRAVGNLAADTKERRKDKPDMDMKTIRVRPKMTLEAVVVDQQRTVGMERGHTAQPGDYLLKGVDGSLHHFSKSEFERMFGPADVAPRMVPVEPERSRPDQESGPENRASQGVQNSSERTTTQNP
jgi:hypothetical protein